MTAEQAASPTLYPTVAVQLDYHCWEITCRNNDERKPHARDEAEARETASHGYDTECCTVTLLDAPCWEAHCGRCGQQLIDEDEGWVHYRTEADARDVDSELCDRGCAMGDWTPDAREGDVSGPPWVDLGNDTHWVNVPAEPTVAAGLFVTGVWDTHANPARRKSGWQLVHAPTRKPVIGWAHQHRGGPHALAVRLAEVVPDWTGVTDVALLPGRDRIEEAISAYMASSMASSMADEPAAVLPSGGQS